MRVTIPDGNSWEEAVQFSAHLKSLPPSSTYDFDFEDVRFVTPGWMLAIGSALRKFRDDRPGIRRRVENYRHSAMRYAAHAGFFRSFGMKFGEEPGASAQTEAYLPLTETPLNELRGRAAEKMLHYGDVIQDDAERMVAVLTRLEKGDVFDTLAYSVREIVRNVVEHSEADNYEFAAQWWPTTGVAELVVGDRGIGIARSLRMNPRIVAAGDAEALKLAVSPGVSSRGWRRRAGDVWANTGYGLYMTRGLCAASGSFTLISGARALITDAAGERMVECDAQGTIVVMRMETTSLTDLSDRLSQLRDQASATRKPSVASLSKRVENRRSGG